MKKFNDTSVNGQIAKGMALAFFARAYAELKGLLSGDDSLDSIELPDVIDPAAEHAAFTFACGLRIDNEVSDLSELYNRAREAHRNGEGGADMTPVNFGHYLALQGMGGGVGLHDAFGAHVADVIHVPYIEFGAHSLERDYS